MFLRGPGGTSSPRRSNGSPRSSDRGGQGGERFARPVSDLLARTDLTVLSGDDSLTLPMLAVGAEGVISVVANLIPKDVIALLNAYRNGDLAEARRVHLKLFPSAAICWASHPIHPSRRPGAAGPGQRRTPPAPLSPDERGRETLRRSLIRYGILTG